MNEISSEVFFGMILALGSFLLSMFLTPIYTYFAYKYKFWKKQKKETLTGEALPVMTKLHAHKFRKPFPTMAGIVGLVTVAVVTLTCNLERGWTWLPLAAFLGGGFIGLIDDSINIFGSGKGAAGLRAPMKMFLITVVGLIGGWFFACKLEMTSVMVPFIGDFDLGVFGMILVFTFAVVATSNAVNITDGLDGLAGGVMVLAYGAYGAIAVLQGSWQLAAFCFTVVGWLLSYTWFNIPPARFMMGDTGSFALGAGLGVVAMQTDCFLLLPIIGILLVVEAGSSLLQITSKKLFHRKIFISAPIHHHFEAKGWGEAKVVMRFWILAGVAAFLGVFIAGVSGMIKKN